MKMFKDKKFFGSTTLGKKGQIVIPSEARKNLKLEDGDKLLVFGFGDMLAFSKISQLEKLAEHLSKHLSSIKEVIDKIDK